ncbi:MAG TPA: DUF5313 family protein [Pseudonocardiaceae bacterium]|nr:DUF5313 family protein [Pseudonocardiaceae bacterium]
MPVRRPNPLLWLYYQYGGKLPESYREWVLYDGTSRWWVQRAFLRTLLQAVPVIIVLFVVFAIFGVPWYFAAACLVLGLVVSIYYALSYSVESVDSRLTTYGYPMGYGSTLRQQQYEEQHLGDTERYRQIWQSGEEQ